MESEDLHMKSHFGVTKERWVIVEKFRVVEKVIDVEQKEKPEREITEQLPHLRIATALAFQKAWAPVLKHPLCHVCVWLFVELVLCMVKWFGCEV